MHLPQFITRNTEGSDWKTFHFALISGLIQKILMESHCWCLAMMAEASQLSDFLSLPILCSRRMRLTVFKRYFGQTWINIRNSLWFNTIRYERIDKCFGYPSNLLSRLSIRQIKWKKFPPEFLFWFLLHMTPRLWEDVLELQKQAKLKDNVVFSAQGPPKKSLGT